MKHHPSLFSLVLVAVSLGLGTTGHAQGPSERGAEQRSERGQAQQRDRVDRHYRDGRDDRGGRDSRHDRDSRDGHGRQDDRRVNDHRDRHPGPAQFRNDYYHRSEQSSSGYGRNWRRGKRLPPQYRGRQYVVEDWRGHHLYAPPRGHHWVQSGSDYALVAITTGLIVSILLSN